MCELFGFSSRFPAKINICLHEIALHGGLEGPHGDGWGVAYYEDTAVRLIKEPGPAWNSPWVRLLEREPLESRLVVSHIRHATRGRNSLGNTQPHAREMAGRVHVFAHNGDLGAADRMTGLPLGRFRPIGDTDSEHAFCHLLHRLESLWLEGEGVPPVEARIERLRGFADAVTDLGPANFVYSDGDAMFVHGDCRRNPGESEAHAPGLFALWRNFVKETESFSAYGLRLEATERDDRAVLVASVPLTRENWIPLPRRDVLALRRGRLVATAPVDHAPRPVLEVPTLPGAD